MRELLLDMTRQVGSLFDKIRVEGLTTGTKVEAYSDDKMLFLFADLKDVVPEFAGEFGISNVGLLRQLLDFASYKTEQAKLQARRVIRDDADFVAELEFTDAVGGLARFKTINPRMIGERARVQNINWEVSVTPNRAKLTEVIQLTSMLAQVDQHFGVTYTDRTLFLVIGGKGASSHQASVALAEDIDPVSLPPGMVFRAPHFLAVLKLAGNLPCTIRFAKEGIGSLLIETEHGSYNYLLRGTES